MKACVCRVCLQSAERVRLSRRDLSAFYAVCAMSLGGYQRETSVWVCSYCWTRASQCLQFIKLARKAEFLLRTNSDFDIKPNEFHPYTFSRLLDTIVCDVTECQSLNRTQLYSTEHNVNIHPIESHCHKAEVIKDAAQTTQARLGKIELSEDIKNSLESDYVKKEIEGNSESNLNVKEEDLEINEDFDKFRSMEIIECDKQIVQETQSRSLCVPSRIIVTEEEQMKSLGYVLVRLTVEQLKEEIEKKKEQSIKYRGSKYKCKCGKCFVDEDLYKEHVMMSNNEALGPYLCEICCRRFKTESDISGHSYYQHECKWRCMLCQAFVGKQYCKAHKKNCVPNSTQHECDTCHKKFPTKCRLQRHAVAHKRVLRFTCDYCNKMFRYKHQVASHIRMHTKENLYECEPCGRKFPNMDKYKNHLYTVHKERRDKPIENRYCVECNKFFTNKAGLDSHLTNRFHVGNDKFKFSCDTCSKRFRTRTYLQTHINRVHVKVKNFPCTQCDKAFSTKRVLADHTRVHCDQPRDYVSYMRSGL